MAVPLHEDRIREMIEVIMEVAQEDYSVQVKLSNKNDELDSLAMGINMMIDDIKNTIIERKKAEKTLIKKNQEILAFTDVVTHDLKKPLATMKTICNLISSEQVCSLNEDGTEAIMMGKEAIDYMQELLEDLLACAKMEAGTQSMEFEEININEMVNTVLQKLELQAQEKNIIITQKIDGSIYADRKSMTKVFMNLIGNAINYIGNKPDPEIIINASPNENDGGYMFFVKDNGIGIPKHIQSEIFQKFKRGSNVSGIGGTGLGLSIVKGVVESHGGRVWLESKEREGTTFYFSLPKNT